MRHASDQLPCTRSLHASNQIIQNRMFTLQLNCTGAKLQEQRSGESFNFDIARFAKIAEESRARAEQEAEAAPGSPDAKPAPVKPARDWNAQVGLAF